MVLSRQTEVFFIRHGIAAERGTYANDGDRPLTEKGRQRTAAVAARLVQLDCRVEKILSSPLVRAQQTTELLLGAGIASEAETLADLAPEGSLSDWLSWLGTWQDDHPISRLALVGHEPDLSAWAQQLVTGQDSDRWQLKKAGVIGVTVPEAAGAIGNSELFWLTPPRFLV